MGDARHSQQLYFLATPRWGPSQEHVRSNHQHIFLKVEMEMIFLRVAGQQNSMVE